MAGTLTHDHRTETTRDAAPAAWQAWAPAPRRRPSPTASGHELASRLAARAGTVQPRLRVSNRSDADEIEAERAADDVMREGGSPAKEGCSCGGSCDECQDDEEPAVARASAPPVVVTEESAPAEESALA